MKGSEGGDHITYFFARKEEEGGETRRAMSLRGRIKLTQFAAAADSSGINPIDPNTEKKSIKKYTHAAGEGKTSLCGS